MDCLCPVSQDREVSGTRVMSKRRCGYCEACRLTYRQTWSARIQLEASCYEASTFFTLTYSDDFLPHPPQLVPRDLQLFIKRLRRRLEPYRFRFFACGEYGSRSLRPHYHGVLFGVEATTELEKILSDCWSVDGASIGFVSAAPLSPARAAYVSKYVCKDVSSDSRVPEGYEKEFARMSNRPGIGASYVDSMAAAISAANAAVVARGYPALTELVGGSMKIGAVPYPTGRYIRDRLKRLVPEGRRRELTVAIESNEQWKRECREGRAPEPTVRARRLKARRKVDGTGGVL